MIKKPWLFLPSRWLYHLSPLTLRIYSRIQSSEPFRWKSFSWRQMRFPNPLGIAGGVDKNALHIQDWWRLGAGFLELGTVTPKAQEANPSPVLDRSVKHFSLWNNMGFPNKGMDFARERLLSLPEKRPCPLFVNIGKNRETEISRAFEDYKKLLSSFHSLADAFVINISSPNTQDLRSLFSAKKLPQFLDSLKQCLKDLNSKTPLILKISPDEEDFLRIIEQSLEAGIDGWCLCNTTKQRAVPNLFPKEGGVSGRLVADLSLNLLRELKKYLSERGIKDRLIISCGGVLTAGDVMERLKEGADLVQVYSALVFNGPGFFRSVYKNLF